MSGLELFAAALGVIAVWLTVKQNPWCWPIGLVMVLLYSWIFFEVKLYSDMLLQVIYAALQLYGWWQWTHAGGAHHGRQVSLLDGKSVALGLAHRRGRQSAAGRCDGALDRCRPTLARCGTDWLQPGGAVMDGAKTLQCWPLWITLDVIFVGLFIYKGMYLTAGLYALFALIAVQGWREWRADPALRT